MPLRRRALSFVLLALACDRAPTRADAPDAAAPGPVDVTILYTSDEHGWLLPFEDGGKVWGGAAELLGQWIEREGHCIACADPATLALSGGDNFTGPAISAYF